MTERPIGVLFDVVLRSDFQAFVEKAFSVVFPNDRFVSGWHIEAVCWHLSLAQQGDLTRLIINLPPRSLKSFIVSVAWPAYLLGLDPTFRVICVSYSDDLARDHARLFRALVGTKLYKRLFPRTRISPSKNTESMVATTANGFRLATSIGGTLTGKGGHLIIIDDPIKAEGANSESDRQRNIDWYSSTLVSRLDDPVTGKIIVVQQRVHAFDLSGYLLEQGGWTHLSLPAEARRDIQVPIGDGQTHLFKEGDLLDGARLPGRVLEARSKDLGSAQYSAQYLQEPVPPDGTVIKRSWLSTYDARSTQSFSKVIQSWDVAAKPGPANDWSVCLTLGIARDGYYVVDVARMKVEFPGLAKAASELAQRYKPSLILIEDSSNGTALYQDLNARSRLPVSLIKARLDKESRVNSVSGLFEAGKVRLLSTAAWHADLKRELLEFPGGRHDDQVDALSQALAWARDNDDHLVAFAHPILMPRPPEDCFLADDDISPFGADI